jgi:hypothetical protein
MKIFIFGAGASLGSQNGRYGQESVYRAPLMDELFHHRYRKIARDYLLDDTLLDKFELEISHREDKSVEKWLSEKWVSLKDIKSEDKKRAEINVFGKIVFYIWNVLRIVSTSYDEGNIYHIFLQRFIDTFDEDIGIIDFNYDTLLDQSYEHVYNISFKGNLDTYLKRRFIKPHGSINWIMPPRSNDPNVPQRNDTNLRIRMAMEEYFSGPISIESLEVLNPGIEHLRDVNIAKSWESIGHPFFYPLIFLPLANKDFTNITGFQNKVIERAKNIMMMANEVYLIGYKAEDDIINDLLSVVPFGSQLHVVSMHDAKKISQRVLNINNNLRRGSIINGGFSDFSIMHFQKNTTNV